MSNEAIVAYRRLQWEKAPGSVICGVVPERAVAAAFLSTAAHLRSTRRPERYVAAQFR